MESQSKKPISYWQQKAMVARRNKLKDQMLVGDFEAAKSLLSRSVESLSAAINGEPIDEAHTITLDYLRTSILGFLDGVPLEVAFGIRNEAGGRPRITYAKKLEIFAAVTAEIESLKDSECLAPVREAQDRVARKFGVSWSTVKRIWENK